MAGYPKTGCSHRDCAPLTAAAQRPLPSHIIGKSLAMTQTRRFRSAGPSPSPTALLVLADGTVLEGFGLGATGHAVGEVCFNTAMTGYRGDPDRSLLCRARSSPSPSRISAMSAPTTRTSRPSTWRRRRARAASILHTDITEPSNYRATRHLDHVAEGARHHRPRRHRHPRADRADPREGHAQRGDRARAGRQVRPRRAEERGARVAGPGRHGPRADGDERPALHLGRDAVELGQGLRPAGRIRNSTSSRSTTASSATSCGCSPAPAARSRWCRRRPRPRTSWRSSPTACSSPTAPAIRRRPANMRCR